jgi:hypothetical protein
MKKIIIAIAVLGMVALSTSCKKTYTCECYSYDSNSDKDYHYETVKAKGDLEAIIECDKLGNIYSTPAVYCSPE